MAGFSVNIGADIGPLTAGLSQATAEVQRFSDVVANAAPTTALTTLNNVISTTSHSFDELAASAAAMDRIEAAIDQAAAAATGAGARFDTLGGRLPLQDFTRFSASVNRLRSDISSGLVPQISRIPAALNPIAPAADAAANALNRVRPGANQAGAALTNVGRIAQDLPFGFIGIQNNLNPLLESFQRLRAETGSNGAALRALGSSLMGAGGIGLALSVVSSALLIFQNGIAGFNSKTKEAKDKAEEFAKTLKTVADVIGDATAGQTGGIAQVQALASVVQDTNAAYDQRKRALQDLQQINKSYFGDLKLEEGQMALLTARVNEYSKAIVAQAVLKGFTDEISRVSVELAKQDRALKIAGDNVNRLKRELDNTKQSETSLTGEDRISSKYVKVQKAVKEAEKAFVAQRDIVENLSTNYAELNGQIDGAVKETIKLRDLGGTGKQKEEVDLLKKRLEALEKIKAVTKDASALVGLQEAIFELQVKIAIRDQGKNQLSKPELDQLLKGYRDQLNETFKNQAIELEAIPKVKFSEVKRAELPGNIDSIIAKATGFDKKIPIISIQQVRIKFEKEGLKFDDPAALINALEAAATEFEGKARSILQNAIGDAFTGIGEGLGEGLGKGDVLSGIKKAGQNILQVVGSVVADIGKQMILASKLVIQLKAILASSGFGVGSLAAGVLLVAVGTAIRNVKFNTPKFAQGGIVTGPIVGQIGEMHRPEVIMPLDRLPQMLRSMGGSGGGDTQPVLIFTNEGLYFQMKKGERRAGRKF